ncbi:unnamed protein product [Candidula unifasciata]|uniref:TIR domain-containing protein n=1 Tax=Candidula unifasciata TaxID=100452 RepID=A0A8S3YU78_9EUPU|nr:unnamed protein product [Candidula unifasciata]
MAHGGAYPTITFSSQDCSAEVLQTSRLQPIPESIAAEWLNIDTMEGIVPYSLHDILGTSSYNNELLDDSSEEFRVFETATQDRVVYISHTIREKDRIDPFIYLLHRHFPNIIFKTSSDCADMEGKQEAIDCSELVVIFMSQLYSESHEMALEYSLMGGKEIIVAAHERMTWPPGNYFDGNLHFERLPRTFVDTAANRSSAAGLIDLIDHYLDWEESQSLYGGSSMSNGKLNQSNDSNSYVHENGLQKQQSNKSSTTCVIL